MQDLFNELGIEVKIEAGINTVRSIIEAMRSLVDGACGRCRDKYRL